MTLATHAMESSPMDHGYQVVITDLLTTSLAPEREVLGDLATWRPCTPALKRSWLAASSSADAVILYHETCLTAVTLDRLGSAG